MPHPEILWAQRSSTSEPKKNIVFLTINLPDIQEPTLQCDLSATGLKFKAKAGNASKGIEEKDYDFDLEFYDEIDPAESSQRLNTRALDLVLRKKEPKAEFWPRLYKGPKLQFVKTNFGKWVDEDEQDEAKPVVEDEDEFNPMAGMGGGMMGGGMPNMMGGGMPGNGGDVDFEKMLADIRKDRENNPSGSGGADEDSDDSDDGPPPLEDAPAQPAA